MTLRTEDTQVKEKHRRITQMLQSGPEDNAQTALAMVLTSLGSPVSPWELPAMESAADLVSQARLRGMYAEGRGMTARELRSAPLPAIVHWRHRSFAVVSRVRGGRVWLHDPAEGLRVLGRREFDEGFTGVAVCVAGQGEGTPAAKGPQARTLFQRFPAATLALAVMQAFLCVCCAGALLALRLLAQDGGRRGAWLFFAAAVLQLGTALAQNLFLHSYEVRLRRSAAERCDRQLGRKSQLFFRQVQLHQMAYACDSCGWVGKAQTELWLQSLRLAGPAVCLALLAAQDLWAGAAALVPALVWTGVLRDREEPLQSACLEAGRERFLLRHQTAREMEETEPLRGENRKKFEQWLSQAGGRPDASQEERLRWSWYVFCGTELASVLLVGLTRLVRGGMSLEMLAGCLGAAAYFAGTLRALPRRIRARAALRSVQETWTGLFGGEPAARPAGMLEEEGETLSLHNVRLPAAQAGDQGLRGVSLSVKRGEVLSVVTDGDRLALSRLIAGIVPPAQGMVCIGSANLRELGEEELYRNVVQLGRGLPLPRGTVRENITAGRQGVSDQKVAAAAGCALLHRRIMLRKEGYDTLASTLSEGERVLLEFACAFARETPFLVADQCVRTLDPETQRKLLETARRRGAGTVLVDDGPEPVRWADAVCRIREGRVVLSERSEIVDWEGTAVVQSGS